MKLRDIISALEQWAPPVYQESFDNSGLIVGDPDAEVFSAMVALDCIESVVDEAIEKRVDVVIAHHPIVFSGLKKFTGSTYVERTVMKAIKHGVAIYAIHTNLDNVAHGVNQHLAQLLGLSNLKVLAPKSGLLEKLVVFVPREHAEVVRAAMFASGGGVIGDYSECSFSLTGDGTFMPGENTDPFVGQRGTRHTEAEERVEVIVHAHLVPQVIAAMRGAHPYEEVACDRYALNNDLSIVGSGMMGVLPEPTKLYDFLDVVKSQLSAQVVRHTAESNNMVQRIAVCGGSGFFLLGAARKAGAEVFLTSDVKYHQFFDADGITLIDVGHWESEHRTVELIASYLNDKFPKFAVHFSQTNTNPVKYY